MYYNSRSESGCTGNGTLKKRDKEGLRTTETLFNGGCNVQPGMFLRKAR